MTELRESLSEQIQLREDFEQKLKDMEEQQGGAFADQAVDAPSVTSGALKEEVSQGIRLGAQVLSAQMDVLQTRSVRDSLSEMMNQVETKDALAEVLEDLRRTDEELEHRGALLEALESEWTQFREQTSPEAVALLDDLIGIVENEMKQSRAAEARVALLQQQLEDITLGDASPDNSIQEEIDDLKAQLEERTILADELEEELATVSAQLTELNDQLVREQNHAPPISWSENSALRDELKEKTELLERYRAERLREPSTHDSLEEELQNLNARYQAGRERIVELLKELEDRDRRLRALAHHEEPGPPLEKEQPVSDLVDLDSFELPLPSLDDFAAPSDFTIKEDTLEDLPAIPYTSDEETSD